MAKENTTIDKDLYEGLQQARKKKPRYFALIAKASEVVGLIVQKKVINDSLVQKKKSECQGNLAIAGVCCGEGAALTFQVLGAEPSILPKKIKDFIEEQTDLALKPQWGVVKELSAVVDDEDPLASTSQPSASPPAPSSTSDAAKAVDPSAQGRLKSLLEHHKTLVGDDAALKMKLQPFAKLAAELVMKGSAEAPAALDKLEKSLQAVESIRAPVSVAASQRDDREVQQAIACARKYLELLDKLEAAIDKPVSAPLDTQADKQECQQAIDCAKQYLGLLDKLEAAIDKPVSAPLATQADEQECRQAIDCAKQYLSLLDKLEAAITY